MISEKPGMAQPYVGRGTAYAMKRLLLEVSLIKINIELEIA
jgi:hypothetical protein